jgi:anti-sigma regulatory factor (Ser/Thr protein kinase)
MVKGAELWARFMDVVRLPSVTLPAESSCVRAARSWARDHCEATWDPGVCDDLVLVASELFSNAVLHGRGPVQISLVQKSGHIRLQVFDTGPTWGHDTIPDNEHGRGLVIVDALSRAWGMTAEHGGRTVWAEFDCSSKL